MKKFFSFFFFFLLSLSINAGTIEEASVSYYIGGYWDEWGSINFRNKLKFNDNSLIQYDSSAHPSEFKWRLKHDAKYYAVDGEWEVYHGTFEYYITDEQPTLLSILKSGNWVNPIYHDVSKGQTPCVKKTENVKVKRKVDNIVKRYRNGYDFWGYPKYKEVLYKHYTYNIWFDNGGFAVDFKTISE